MGLSPARMRSERCHPQEFLDDSRLSHRDKLEPLLRDFSPERALAVLEDPFVPRLSELLMPAHPSCDSPASVAQVLEIMLACGYGDWLVARIPEVAPHVAAICALSQHPRVMVAAATRLGVPALGATLERLVKPRATLADILAVAAVGREYDTFREAVRDAIERYALTADVLDSAIDPLAWFAGFERASSGKLAYFFIEAPHDYHAFDALWRGWTGVAPAPPVAGSGAMLYATCYHYRACVLGECLRTRDGAGDDTVVRTLLDTMEDRIGYYQNGSVAAFHRDTVRMAARILGRPLKRESTAVDDGDVLIARLTAMRLIELGRPEVASELAKRVSAALRTSDPVDEVLGILEDDPRVDEVYATKAALERLIATLDEDE